MQVQAWLSVVGVLAVAAITPGPNNFMAMQAWLGASLIFRRATTSNGDTLTGMPTSLWGIAVFQLLNPKAWILITTAVAAMTEATSVLGLAALVALISSICLSIWAIAGAVSSRWLATDRARDWFNHTMGALLALSALGIIVDAVL